jgi:superfamily I DNA/RNA helicase
MKSEANSLFDGLNMAQREAVVSVDGPVLVVAGPGTGKTLTIVRRIAHLVRQGVQPERVLAVTFTNRAAREMRERAVSCIGRDVERVFIGTFHLLGLRLVQEHRSGDFSILDRAEQVEVLRTVLNGSLRQARETAERLSRAKNLIEEPDQELASVLASYERTLVSRNALDFDDLIRVPIDILGDDAVAATCRERYQYLIVDEYQDINPAQYWLLRRLAGERANVCAVGDPDQAIYSFRGADVRNFLAFEQDFAGAKRIVLSENYRSSGNIVGAAASVIRNNVLRFESKVAATREQGERLTVLSVRDEGEEGRAIIGDIEGRMGGTSRMHHYRRAPRRPGSGGAYRFSDFAVIYRTNAQAGALEETFAASGIPYQVIGNKGSAQHDAAEATIDLMRSLIPRGDGSEDSRDAGQEARLLTPADYFDPRADAVALMTLHMAKGLEFRVVYLAGAESGVIPYTLNREDADLEEERRLFYVGMTRAKDELILLHAKNRFLYGKRLDQLPSPFLAEIPAERVTSREVPGQARKRHDPDRQMDLF